MRARLLAAVLALSAVPALALAQPQKAPSTPATLCLDPNGSTFPPVCHTQSASRFASPPDICLCDGPYRRVDAPWCAKGETPPADTAAFDQARAKASQDGSLFGDLYQGKPMCVSLKSGGG